LPALNYEYWVQFNFAITGAATGFDEAILHQPTGDTAAPVPVARLIDTKTYFNNRDPNATLTPAIGIAEFANANFFSEDTGIGQYPFPDPARLVLSQHPVTGIGVRSYWAKGAGDGIPVDPALAECGLDELEGRPSIHYKCMDQNTWAATAQVMVPRAIGYARGVLNYFFRGRVEIAPPPRYVYGLARWEPGNAGSFTSLKFKVRNATPGDETGAGNIIAAVRYRRSTAGDVIVNPQAPLGPEIFAVSAPQPVTLTRSFQELTFDFSANPIPTNSADLFLTVVYRGPLGLEETEAFAVGGKDLREPDPFDRANITDYDCFNGTPFQVASSTGILPPYQFPDHTERDVDGDRIQDLFGPWTERGVFLKTFDLAGPIASAGPGNFDESTAEIGFAQFSRFVLLQDRDFYGMAVLRQQLSEFSTGFSFFNLTEAAAIDGIVNHLFQLGPFLVHEFNLSTVYRGLTTYRIFLLLSSPAMDACLPGSEAFTPNLTQAPDIVSP
jgi:hypothetical protein